MSSLICPPVTDGASRATQVRTDDTCASLVDYTRGTACSDSMSGESFETRVSLVFDGIAYSGCGRALH